MLDVPERGFDDAGCAAVTFRCGARRRMSEGLNAAIRWWFGEVTIQTRGHIMTATPDLAPRRLRDIFGTFASGLTVITGSTPEGPAGFTCQSFASLSLEPALVTFSPART